MSGKPRILITGCSSAGKSTLLDAIRATGRIVVSEPGRRIVEAEKLTPTGALPWENPVAFAMRAKAMALQDLADVSQIEEAVYFDRGLLDAAVALQHAGGHLLADILPTDFPYSEVLVAEPWEELFQNDEARRQPFTDAVAEYDRIIAALTQLNIRWRVLPRVPVNERLASVIHHVDNDKGPRL